MRTAKKHENAKARRYDDHDGIYHEVTEANFNEQRVTSNEQQTQCTAMTRGGNDDE